MKLENIKPGVKVKTNNIIEKPIGMFVDKRFINQRQSNKEAFVYAYVPGHGGDVWWLSHEPIIDGLCKSNSVAPYFFDEFEEI